MNKEVIALVIMILTYSCKEKENHVVNMDFKWEEIDTVGKITDEKITQVDNVDTLNIDAVEKDTICNNPCVFPVAIDSNLVFSSYYGKRLHPIHGKSKFHHGIDIISNYALASNDGIIEMGEEVGGYGKYVILKGSVLDAMYAHLDSIYVKANERVRALDTIGIIGSSGVVTGKHLHYELRFKDKTIDPIEYFKMTINK